MSNVHIEKEKKKDSGRIEAANSQRFNPSFEGFLFQADNRVAETVPFGRDAIRGTVQTGALSTPLKAH